MRFLFQNQWSSKILQQIQRVPPPRDVPFARALGITLTIAAGITLLYMSDLGKELERRLSHPVSFQFRHWLGQDPKLDPRIKIYAFDDSTLKFLDDEDLPISEWAKVFGNFKKTKVRAVLIDKMFGTPKGRERAKQFVKAMKALEYPVVAGAVITSTKSRTPLPLDRPEYSLETLSKAGKLDEPLSSVPVHEEPGGFPTGPHPDVFEGFRRIGHINYEGTSLVSAFKHINESTALPAAPLLTSKEMYFDNGELYLDGNHVPLDGGRIFINLANPSQYYKKTYALSNVIKRARRNQLSNPFPDDSVVLLLFMYSPNVDMAQTPFGLIPGGFVITALVNSVLTGKWINFLPGKTLWVFIFACLGGIVGAYFSGLTMTSLLTAGGLGTITLGLGLFSFASVYTPWLFASTGFLLCGGIVYFEKSRLVERRTRRVRAALDGLVPPNQLMEIVKQPASLIEHPKEHVITVMFIDVMGFYLSAEHQTPQTVFHALKKLLSELTSIVHKHGGIIDKTTGDGLLCYFGYHYATGTVDPNHATEALECAIEIQRKNVDRNLDAKAHEEAIYPLRIGLNTGNVYMGDLGSEERMDFAIIGHSINFAQRLESSCEDYCIMLGAGTHDLVAKCPTGVGIKKKMLQIKHYEDLVEGYEYDPLEGRAGDREKAILAFYEFANKESRNPRWDIPPEFVIDANAGKYGKGSVVNFSRGGLAVQLDQYLARQVVVKLHLNSPDTTLANELDAMGLQPLVAEIRWGRPREDGTYLHGVQLRNINEEQSRKLIELFRHSVSQRILKIANS